MSAARAGKQDERSSPSDVQNPGTPLVAPGFDIAPHAQCDYGDDLVNLRRWAVSDGLRTGLS
jgi:hypothetical protein